MTNLMEQIHPGARGRARSIGLSLMNLLFSISKSPVSTVLHSQFSPLADHSEVTPCAIWVERFLLKCLLQTAGDESSGTEMYFLHPWFQSHSQGEQQKSFFS